MPTPAMVKPPGTILQQMYFKERLRHIEPGFFVEIGVGRGELSLLLLEQGWQGVGYDLNPESAGEVMAVNDRFVRERRFEFRNADWLESDVGRKADMILSCMVLEHLDEEHEARYFEKCKADLSNDGLMVLLVPAGERYWGIEDEIAGHYRRYTRELLLEKMQSFGFHVRDIAGLTFPVSNLLLPLSEFLVHRTEHRKKTLSMEQRTVESGIRKVPFKTTFPSLLGLVLNETVMYPFHWAQKLARKNPRAMVLYAEGKPVR